MADQNPWEINYSPVSGAPPSPPQSTTGYAFKGLAGTEPIVLPRVTQQAAAASSAGGAKEPWEIEYQTPPAPPPQPSPVAKAGGAFWEGIGGPQWAPVIKALSNPSLSNPDAPDALAAVWNMAKGLAAEPGRVWNELGNTGAAMLKGDPLGAAYHLAGSVPLFGAPAQQVAQDLQRGDPAAAVGHTGAIIAPLVVGPAAELAGRGIAAIPESVSNAAAATKAGVTAAAPDVAKGAAKVGLAYGASYLPIPAEIKYGVGIPTAGSGAKQIFSGLKTGVNAARTSLAETAAPEAAAAPEAGAASAAAAPAAAPVGAPTDDALIHLYSVETDPVKRGALQKELTDRGLMQQPGAAPWNTSALNPYRSYSQDALRNVYRVEQDPVKRALIEQTAADRNLSLLNRDARRATVEVPETGYAEAPGPSLTQDDALMLRYLGEKDPMAADAETIGVARQYAAASPELMARLRAGDVEPIVAPAEQTAPAAQKPVELNLAYDAPGVTPTQPEPAAVPGSGGTAAASPALTAPTPTAGQVYAEATGENWARLSPKNRLLMEQLAQAHANAAEAALEEATRPTPATPPAAAPQIAPQTPPAAPEAPAPPPTAPPAPETPVAAAPQTPPLSSKELAAQLEASMRVETLTDYLTRNKVPAAMLDIFGDKEWRMVADQAGVQPPDAANIQAIRGNLADYEGAAQITAKTPADAAAEFAQNRSIRTKRQAPAAPADLEGQLADSVAAVQKGERPAAAPPPDEPAALTASQKRVEAFAQHLAADKSVTSAQLANLPANPQALALLEQLGESLDIEGRPAPGEPQAIVDRVRELRGESLRKPPNEGSATTAAASPAGIPADIGKLPTADIQTRFRAIVSELRGSMGANAENMIRGELPSRYPGWSGEIPTSDIKVDPVRFQFKRDVGQGGAGAKLKDINVWDPNKGGTILVWKDPANGETYVINGHHRIELAQRLNVPDVNVRYLHAADAADARLQGALVNVSEGNGDVMDAAKVFRESGLTPGQLKAEGVALDGRLARDGMAIANLSPTMFQAVLSGDLSEARGAVIGQLQSHADQHAVFNLMRQAEKRGSVLNDAQMRELIRMNERAPTVTESSADSEQGGLFGDIETTRSLLPEKAKVSAYVREQLRSDKRLFGAVSSQAAAERLGSTGNVIQPAENLRVAEQANQGSALYDKLSTLSGPIDRALNDAAESIAKGESVSEVNKRTYRTIRGELERQLQSLTREPEGSDPGTAGHSPQGTIAGGTGEPGDSDAGDGHPQPETLGDLMQPKAAARKRRAK